MPVIDALMYAFIYARWSSLEQGKGTTLTRQLEVCRDYCRAQGWTIAGELRDEGRSAYTGENIRTGELGEFFRRSEQGLLPADSVLVIEQLDRLSRLPALEVLSYIQRVAAAGLTIATVNDKALINATTLKEDQLQIVGLVFNSFRAYGESKHKSDRLTEAWQIKRREYEAGKRKQLTTICPAWLRWNEDADRFDAIEDRVVVLNRIFDEADRGDGKRVIAARLNREGVPVWGRGANLIKQGDERENAKLEVAYRLVVHEMLHQLQYQLRLKRPGGHGETFIKEAVSVAQSLGIPPPTKGDAGAWPDIMPLLAKHKI